MSNARWGAALDTDAAGDTAGEPERGPDQARIDYPLSREEEERGMRAADEVKRLARELLERRGGKQFPPCSELLHEMREERTRDLGEGRSC